MYVRTITRTRQPTLNKQRHEQSQGPIIVWHNVSVSEVSEIKWQFP